MSAEQEIKTEMLAAKEAWNTKKETVLKECIRMIREHILLPYQDNYIRFPIPNTPNSVLVPYLKKTFSGFGYNVEYDEKKEKLTISWDGVE